MTNLLTACLLALALIIARKTIRARRRRRYVKLTAQVNDLCIVRFRGGFSKKIGFIKEIQRNRTNFTVSIPDDYPNAPEPMYEIGVPEWCIVPIKRKS